MKRLAGGLAGILLIASGAAQALQLAPEHSDPLVPIVHDYLQSTLEQQSSTGKIIIDVMPALSDAGRCLAPDPFIPAGQLMRGNITVGVICTSAPDHEIPRYYRAHIGMETTYLVASHDLSAGTLLSGSDISSMRGDITRLPNTALTDASLLIGQRVVRHITAGALLQAGMVKAAPVITRNSRVTVTARTAGYTITAQGTAMDEAVSNGQLRVRMDSKKMIMARATAPGEAALIP